MLPLFRSRSSPPAAISRLWFVAALSLSAIATAQARTAVLFGATGAVGFDVLRAVLDSSSNGSDGQFFTKVVLVGRRFPPKVMDVLPPQTPDKLPEVVRIELPDLGEADQHEELLAMQADACFVAVGSAFPHLSDLHDWHAVEVTMAGSMARLCGKLNATSITIFTAVDPEKDPKAYSDQELAKTGNPIGWWPVLTDTMRMMGMKERAVVANSEGTIPFVRIFQPSNIITKETRYGWFDWTIFKFHGVFDPWLPTKYHSVTTELLANAMVKDAVNILSGTTPTPTETAITDDVDDDGATRFSYGDFLRIVGEGTREKNTEL